MKNILFPINARKTRCNSEDEAEIYRLDNMLTSLLLPVKNDLKYSIDNIEIEKILRLIIKELNTKGMNYSPFCQYFNVHNMNYSIFVKLPLDKQLEVLKFIIVFYINDRHFMYLSHGYSNIVLQVMSDNYSHKRKGSYGANKIADLLKIIGIPDLVKLKNQSFNQDCYFLDNIAYIDFVK